MFHFFYIKTLLQFTTKICAFVLVEVCDECTKHLHSILILYIKLGRLRYIDKAVGKLQKRLKIYKRIPET